MSESTYESSLIYNSNMVCAVCGNPDFKRVRWNDVTFKQEVLQDHTLRTISFDCLKMMALCNEHYQELKRKARRLP